MQAVASNSDVKIHVYGKGQRECKRSSEGRSKKKKEKRREKSGGFKRGGSVVKARPGWSRGTRLGGGSESNNENNDTPRLKYREGGGAETDGFEVENSQYVLEETTHVPYNSVQNLWPQSSPILNALETQNFISAEKVEEKKNWRCIPFRGAIHQSGALERSATVTRPVLRFSKGARSVPRAASDDKYMRCDWW